MNPQHRPPLNLVIFVLIVALGLPLGYFAAYVLRSSLADWPSNVSIRGYHTEWEARLFVPAAKIEGFAKGRHMYTVGPSGETR